MKLFSCNTLLIGILFPLLLTTACHMGDSSYMSKSDQQQMQSTFESLQKEYKKLLHDFEQDSTSMPEEMKNLYVQMQQMHRNMDENHRHMMSGHRQREMHQDDEQGMMGRKMRMHMQNRMTAEWYNQMKGMHQQMAQMHLQMSHSAIAERHQHMAQKYAEMISMTPKGDDLKEDIINEEGDPSVLNGESLYAQNCASCHGNNGQGIGNAFPPLVDSKWITGDPSIPVRIVRDGLQGEIKVNGMTYNGTMPSFKARLSVAEIATIINHLRDLSEGDHTKLTQNDVIETVNTSEKRRTPWKANELLEQ